MMNSADPDQLASSEAIWIYTVWRQGMLYLAREGLNNQVLAFP